VLCVYVCGVCGVCVWLSVVWAPSVTVAGELSLMEIHGLLMQHKDEANAEMDWVTGMCAGVCLWCVCIFCVCFCVW